jgi:hypothetical protein
MDWLIKMELAKANLERAITELSEIDGLEYMVDGLTSYREVLTEEITEYKQHSDLD